MFCIYVDSSYCTNQTGSYTLLKKLQFQQIFSQMLVWKYQSTFRILGKSLLYFNPSGKNIFKQCMCPVYVINMGDCTGAAKEHTVSILNFVISTRSSCFYVLYHSARFLCFEYCMYTIPVVVFYSTNSVQLQVYVVIDIF